MFAILIFDNNCLDLKFTIFKMSEEENVRETMTEKETVDFNFESWANSLKLPRKVTQVLRQEELCSKEAISLLEQKDLKELGLPVGCVKLILRDIQLWNGAQSPAVYNQGTEEPAKEGNTPSNEEILNEAGNALDSLLLGTNNHKTNIGNANVSHMDPRTILTMKATSKKAVHITQFLTEKCKRRRQNRRKEFVIRSGQTDQQTMIFKTEEEHPYLGIHLEEWGAANCRLMNHLLSAGFLKRGDIEYYLAYTTKVFEFADIYEWSSVLNFDHTYRELQAEHGFQWGTFSPHMELQLLVPKRVRQSQDSQPIQRSQTEECRIFLAKGSCPFGPKCRYKHTKPQSQKHGTFSPPNTGNNPQREA